MRNLPLAILSALALAAALSACGEARTLGEGRDEACTNCHGLPPPLDHPQIGDCFDCHSASVDEQTNIKPDGGHLNGRVDFAAEGATCSTCHGYPPAAPHPQIADCSECHADTVRDDDETIIPREEGGGHMNGHVDATGGHELGFLAVHGTAANANISSCTDCHGADYGGGTVGTSCNACHGGDGYASWQTNCTFCHGQKSQSYTAGDILKAAPPEGVDGETLITQAPVGAHQKHLGSGSVVTNGFSCDACHAVPTDLSHVNGAARAELTWGTLARTGSLTPSYDGARCSNVYCHGASLTGGNVAMPTWTAPPSQLCGSCHGLPPSTGQHSRHVTTQGMACADCHAGYTSSSTNKATHVNGTRDVVFQGTSITGWDCTTCHALR